MADKLRGEFGGGDPWLVHLEKVCVMLDLISALKRLLQVSCQPTMSSLLFNINIYTSIYCGFFHIYMCDYGTILGPSFC